MDIDTLHILLADDDSDDIFLFQGIINEMKYAIDVTVAQDGVECIDFVKSRDLPYDILFLDINMPKADGLSCLGTIRRISSYINTPIIMLSTASDRKTIESAHRLGATQYISKSCDYKELKRSVQNVINERFVNNPAGPKLHRVD